MKAYKSKIKTSKCNSILLDTTTPRIQDVYFMKTLHKKVKHEGKMQEQGGA